MTGISLSGTPTNTTLSVPVDLQGAAGANPVFGAGTTGDTNNRVELDANGNIRFGTGAAPVDATISRNSAFSLNTPALNVGGNVDCNVAGQGLKVSEGANGKQGTAVLVAGTVTVANTNITANSRIMLTTQVPGGTAGFLVVSARVVGTSFTILSSNAADTSTVAFEIFEPG